MPFPFIPVAVGGGVLAATGVALRLRALAKLKANQFTGKVLDDYKKENAGKIAHVSDSTIKAYCDEVGITDPVYLKRAIDSGNSNPDPIVVDAFFAQALPLDTTLTIMMDSIDSGINPRKCLTDKAFARASNKNRPGIPLTDDGGNFIGFSDGKGGITTVDTTPQPEAVKAAPIPVVTVPVTVSAGRQAVIQTNDPAPSGDLILRSAPSASAPQIGGADKGGTVTVLDDTDATFALISWSGGRNPPCQGYGRKAFLRLL